MLKNLNCHNIVFELVCYTTTDFECQLQVDEVKHACFRFLVMFV